MFFERLEKAGVDIPASLDQHRIMLGEPENQFSLTRAALSTRSAQKQIPISIASLRVGQCRLGDPLFHNDKNGMS